MMIMLLMLVLIAAIIATAVVLCNYFEHKADVEKRKLDMMARNPNLIKDLYGKGKDQ